MYLILLDKCSTAQYCRKVINNITRENENSIICRKPRKIGKTTAMLLLYFGGREIEMLLPIGMQWPLLEMLSFTGHISVATYGTWGGSRSFP